MQRSTYRILGNLPRFSFQYNLTDNIKLKGGYGKHFQFVNRIVNENVTEGSRDFWLLADDDLVKVSSAEHFVIGAAYETDGYIFDVEAYRKNLDNLAEFSLRFQRNDIDLDQLFFLGTGFADLIMALSSLLCTTNGMNLKPFILMNLRIGDLQRPLFLLLENHLQSLPGNIL